MKMDLQQVGRVCVDWINLDQGRNSWRGFVDAVMNLVFSLNGTGGICLH